jgi:cytoskeletal protein CcmA (bactofilin family)
MRIKIKIMKIKIKRRTMIKGEMQMINTRKMTGVQDRHTQESTKQSNEITP